MMIEHFAVIVVKTNDQYLLLNTDLQQFVQMHLFFGTRSGCVLGFTET